MKFQLKQDKYRKARGGKSLLLDLRCACCNGHLMVYQKDGAGELLRCYYDRIRLLNIGTEILVEPSLDRLFGIEKLICSSCEAPIGEAMVYEREERSAFRLFKGTVSKKIIKPQRRTKDEFQSQWKDEYLSQPRDSKPFYAESED